MYDYADRVDVSLWRLTGKGGEPYLDWAVFA